MTFCLRARLGLRWWPSVARSDQRGGWHQSYVSHFKNDCAGINVLEFWGWTGQGDVERDTEAMENMDDLGKTIVWLLKSLHKA